MEGQPFFSADAVVVAKEITNPKQPGKTPWTIVHFVVADPETNSPSTEKLMRQGTEAEMLGKLNVGDCVQLSVEMRSGGLGRTFPHINGFTPTKKRASLTFK